MNLSKTPVPLDRWAKDLDWTAHSDNSFGALIPGAMDPGLAGASQLPMPSVIFATKGKDVALAFLLPPGAGINNRCATANAIGGQLLDIKQDLSVVQAISNLLETKGNQQFVVVTCPNPSFETKCSTLYNLFSSCPHPTIEAKLAELLDSPCMDPFAL